MGGGGSLYSEVPSKQVRVCSWGWAGADWGGGNVTLSLYFEGTRTRESPHDL